MTDIKPDSPDHVILYAMVRWFARHKDANPPALAEIVAPERLCDLEGPVGFYGKSYVNSRFPELKEQGYVTRATFHGRSMGYVLTEESLEALDELGTPQQYDH